MNDIRKKISYKDRNILNIKPGQEWIPPDPAELILPYIEEDPIRDETPIDRQKRKAKEVYDGYKKISDKCEELKELITETCKTVTVPIDKHFDLKVVNAVKRVFGTNGEEITFEMYKAAIDKLTEISNNSVLRP